MDIGLNPNLISYRKILNIIEYPDSEPEPTKKKAKRIFEEREITQLSQSAQNQSGEPLEKKFVCVMCHKMVACKKGPKVPFLFKIFVHILVLLGFDIPFSFTATFTVLTFEGRINFFFEAVKQYIFLNQKLFSKLRS